MPDSIADRVRILRRKLDMTQAEFAGELLISRDYLSQIENGREPSKRIVRSIDLLERTTENPWPDSLREDRAPYKVTSKDPSGVTVREEGDRQSGDETRESSSPMISKTENSDTPFTEEPELRGKEPTIDQCEEYFHRFLREARNAPGGLGWTFNELKEHFPLHKWEEEEGD